MIRSGEDVKSKIKSILQEDNQLCIHFDDKRIVNHEHQVVCLKSSVRRKLKFGIVKCDNGSSLDIFNAQQRLRNECDVWKYFKMIKCDTIAVNTERINGVVVKLLDEIVKRRFHKQQYIGCQHHTLDIIAN